MRRKFHLVIFLVLVSIFIVLIQAQVEETFFESRFDGAWAGSIRILTSLGTREFPAVLNLNLGANTGTMGSALLPKSFKLSPEVLVLYGFKQFIRTGNKIVISIEAQSEPDPQGVTVTYIHTLTLNYSKAKQRLQGKFKSTDPAIIGQKPMALYPQIPEKPTQKIWEGAIPVAGVNTPVFLQYIQKNAVDTTQAAQPSDVSGFGFIGDDYGRVTNASFDGIKLTGNLNLSSELVLIDAQVKPGPKLFTKLNAFTYKRTKLMKPAGTLGNKIKVNNAIPNELILDFINALTITGNNFYPGVMVHVSNPNVMVDEVQYQTRSRIIARLVPSAVLPAGQSISLRVVNINGEFFDRTNAFTTKVKEQPKTVFFAQDIQPVFNQNCALSGCHAGSAPAEGMNLSQGQAYGNIVNVASRQRSSLLRIKPFDAIASYLIHKIQGRDISGARMPLNRSPLSADIIAKFENWVNEGAENN